MILNYWAKGGKERVYINRSEQIGCIYSVKYWVEPIDVGCGGANWQFRCLIKDAESQRRRYEIETEFHQFTHTELAFYLASLSPSFRMDQITWADWMKIGQLSQYRRRPTNQLDY